ncbi:MAG: hypothetical protein EA416_11675 [Trueperaceae bacterium]|nr:MAG: hypothetical protein EA416_11675 [Trueperaceae bacterium]
MTTFDLLYTHHRVAEERMRRAHERARVDAAIRRSGARRPLADLDWAPARHVRTSWGNDHGSVEPTTVARQRRRGE